MVLIGNKTRKMYNLEDITSNEVYELLDDIPSDGSIASSQASIIGDDEEDLIEDVVSEIEVNEKTEPEDQCIWDSEKNEKNRRVTIIVSISTKFEEGKYSKGMKHIPTDFEVGKKMKRGDYDWKISNEGINGWTRNLFWF